MTSSSLAAASVASVGNRAMNRSKYGTTTASVVCCAISSETSVRYGDASRRQGSSRRAPSYHRNSAWVIRIAAGRSVVQRGVAPPQQQPDIAGALARGQIDPIYCLSGEPYLVEATAAAIRATVLAEAGAAAAFNHDTFELKDKGVGAALSTARTVPMMARRRLVVGKGVDDVKAADLEPLAAYAEDPNPSTCLLLLAEKVDVRFKVFQTLRKRGYLHVFGPLRDREVPGWIRTEARNRKIAIAADAARRWPPPPVRTWGASRRFWISWRSTPAASRSPSRTSTRWSPRRGSAASSS